MSAPKEKDSESSDLNNMEKNLNNMEKNLNNMEKKSVREVEGKKSVREVEGKKSVREVEGKKSVREVQHAAARLSRRNSLSSISIDKIKEKNVEKVAESSSNYVYASDSSIPINGASNNLVGQLKQRIRSSQPKLQGKSASKSDLQLNNASSSQNVSVPTNTSSTQSPSSPIEKPPVNLKIDIPNSSLKNTSSNDNLTAVGNLNSTPAESDSILDSHSKPKKKKTSKKIKKSKESLVGKKSDNAEKMQQVLLLEKRLDEMASDSPVKQETSAPVQLKKKKKSASNQSLSATSATELGKESPKKEKLKREDSSGKQKASDENIVDIDSSIVSISIHKADALVSHMNLKHPLVQVHIIDLQTGTYLSKSESTRLVTSSREPNHITYILPTITKTFELLLNETQVPLWNHKIVYNERYYQIIASNVIIMFEVLDFVTNVKANRILYPDGWNRVAWAFFKPIGSDGKPNTEKELRLQLYKYPWKFFPSIPKGPIPFVYQCYKQPWKKYPSTLYVKIGAQQPLEQTTVMSRPKFPNEIETGRIPIDQLLGQMKKINIDNTSNVKKITLLANVKPNWRRKEGDLCRLPNRILYRVDVGQRGSFSCCFSNNGLLLAVACVNSNSYPIKIYQIDTGERIATLEGHQDLVYQLTWSKDDKQLISASSDGSTRVWVFAADGVVRQSSLLLHPTFVYTSIFHPIRDSPSVIVTGAYDGKIRCWRSDPNSGIEKSNTPDLKLEGHKSNVNTLCFNMDGTRLYSGDGAGIIKIWSSESVNQDNDQNELRYECIKTVDSLKGQPIQALRLHPSDRKLMAQTIGPNLHMLDTRIHRILTQFELPNSKKVELDSVISVTSSQSKLFGSANVLEELNAAKNQQKFQLNSIHQISSSRFVKCNFSACGTFVFVGSVKGSVHFWRSESGAYLGSYNAKSLSSWTKGNHPIVDISFHPKDHIIAFSVWGDKEPMRVYTWDPKYPEMRSLEEAVQQTSKHLNVDKLVSDSMANLMQGLEINTIQTGKQGWKKGNRNVVSDMVPLLL